MIIQEPLQLCSLIEDSNNFYFSKCVALSGSLILIGQPLVS